MFAALTVITCLVFGVLGSENKTSYHLRRQVNHETGDKNAGKLRWMKWAEIDGVKNEDVAVLVTSTITKDEQLQYQRIIPSARTWMADFANVFVLIEDSFVSRYAMRHCERTEAKDFTIFNCPNEPHYILSRSCENSYYGATGPCCKVDELFNFITNENPDLYSHLKYVFHCDDDTYFRADQILRYVGSIEKAGIAHYPIVGNGARSELSLIPSERSGGVWNLKGRCKKEIFTGGWYQPLMVNKPAMDLMRVAFASRGVQETCKYFGVTHDVGLGPFFWMFGVWHIQLPATNINAGHSGYSILQTSTMIIHAVRPSKDDGCLGDLSSWSEGYRYKQNMAIGCGDIYQPDPVHDRNKNILMYDVYEYFEANGTDTSIGIVPSGGYTWTKVILHPPNVPENQRVKEILEYASMKVLEKPENVSYDGVLLPGESVEWRIIPRIVKLKGHDETDHGKKQDLTKNWSVFKPQYCES